MLSIGNLTASQFIQRNMSQQIKEITQSTERLSSGKRVNRSSDDPSTVGPISRLNAQVLSLGKAISNGAEGKILTQTADGGLSTINNLLSRIRELAVQGGSTTLTTADRNTLQVEIDAYLTEIDSLTNLITFNTIKLLNGSTDTVQFQLGENKDDNISINLVKSDSSALGLSGASGVKEFTSGRVTSFNYSSNLAASDIKINGQNALAATLTSNLTSGNNTATALVTAINANSNSHGATATGFNKITSAAKSSLSMSNTFTVNTNVISIQTSLENLVTEINQEAGGVTATLNSDNTITLSNTTGNDIVIGGNAPTDAGFTAGTYLGYIKLANVDGTFVKIEAMTKANGYASNSGNIDDLARFGFNEVDSSTAIRSDLVSTNALTASHDIKINDVDIGASDSATAAAKAIAINAVSSSTNVTASGDNLVTLDLNFSEASAASSNISINGNAINFSSVTNEAETITAINNASIGDVIASSNSSGEVQLASASGADITIAHAGTPGVFIDGHTDATGATISVGSSVTFKGQIILTHTAGDVVKISGDDVGELGFQGQASSSASTPGSIVSVSSSSNATSALTTIDNAIDTIANTRAKFGASENSIDSRLNYLLDTKTNSISRLSKIEDADFALETAKLTKAQIMSKAASSMLAQANAGGEVFLRLLN
ncbi:flagellin [Alphaproteobacteria bacterium]|nr:flagellin [Alphaproteobacteria bacterium]